MRSIFAVPVLVVSMLAVLLVGCGAPAAPSAPSLNLPNPAENLSATRIGNDVHLAWTMPTRTTDRVVLKHPIQVQVCRAVESGPCSPVANVEFAPGAAAQYSDALPADLTQGGDRLLRYEVAMRNHAGKSAGPSNIAYSAAGTGPARLTGLTARMRRDGVLLSWQPVEQPMLVSFRIERLQLTAPTEPEKPRSPLAPPIPATAQTLQVQGGDSGAPHADLSNADPAHSDRAHSDPAHADPAHADPGHAIDASALFGQRYRYVVERFVTRSLSGQTIEVQGPPSEPIELVTTDVFPPTVPQGLVAVADSAAGAIDLSWSPDSDSDLAAYDVYRRDTQRNQPAQRVASVGMETSYRDTTVQPGHTYTYSLSAVDQAGNESQHSAEVEETLPSR